MTTPHPPVERLAELLDGTPTLFEREHVAGCASCTKELESLGRLVALANDERRRIAPPLTSWESLRAGLDAADLIADPAARRPASPTRRWTQRVASIALLLAGGAVAGRWSAGLSLADAVAIRGAGSDSAIRDASVVPVALNTGGATFRSTDEALAHLQRAQRAYDDAAAWLSAHDTTSSSQASDQYRTRLAALDMASETFEQALTDAPEDPIINQYYMATMNAREVAIRRLGTTLPASVRMGRY
ncbi:MAG: hypothetical protein IT361_04770 [Gemmatimonadaceae bacterium]|nr:hypothetical protein [Gemmatimonadaceae bacterium]